VEIGRPPFFFVSGDFVFTAGISEKKIWVSFHWLVVGPGYFVAVILPKLATL